MGLPLIAHMRNTGFGSHGRTPMANKKKLKNSRMPSEAGLEAAQNGKDRRKSGVPSPLFLTWQPGETKSKRIRKTGLFLNP